MPKSSSIGHGKRTAAAHLLFQSPVLYQQILDTAMEGIWMIEPHGTITYVNAHMAAMLGYSRKEMLGRDVISFIAKEHRMLMKQRIRQRVKRKHEVFEVKFARKKGDATWATVSANPFFDEQGTYTGCVAMVTDITERKRQEEDLQRTESILHSLMSSAYDAIYVKDRQGKYLMMSAAGARIVDMKTESVVGKYDYQIFNTEIARLSRRTDWQVLRTGKPFTAEQSVLLNSKPMHFITKKVPYKDREGNIKGVVGISIDVTKLKLAESEIRRHKELLEQITRYVSEIFWVAEFPTGKFLYISPAFKKIWGMPVDAVLRDPIAWSAALHPEDREKTVRMFGSVFDERQKNPNADMVFRLLKKDRSIRWMRSRAFPVKDGKGAIIRVVGIVEDITQTKNYENRLERKNEELRRSKERIEKEMQNTRKFQQAVDLSTDAVLMFDTSQRVQYVNKAWEKLCGYSREEILGQKTTMLGNKASGDLSSQPGAYQTLLSGKVLHSDQMIFKRKDGTEVAIDLRLYPIKKRGKIDLFVALSNDITERKRIEHAKSEFSSLVAHQLKTPVAEMRGMVENMLQGITGELNDRQKEYLVAMYKSSKRNLRLISDLLNVSRIQRGIISADIASVPLRDVLGEVIRDYKPVIEGKHLTLHVDDIPDVRILADRDKLLEAIANVMHNAIKFTDKGGIRLETFVEDKHVRIEVKDTGIGISSRNMKKLFKRDQIFSGKPIAGGGAGLGLYIAKQFMLAQNSDITATSKLRHGSTFVFTIPLDSVQ